MLATMLDTPSLPSIRMLELSIPDFLHTPQILWRLKNNVGINLDFFNLKDQNVLTYITWKFGVAHWI